MPKCLITVNDNIIDPEYPDSIVEFKISIIPESVDIYFTNALKFNCYTTMTTYFIRIIIEFGLDGSDNYYEENMKQLDYLYFKNNKNYSYSNTFAFHNKNLRTMMIGDLINKNILKYIRALDSILPIHELKLLIINIFMKLDNWDNLGMHINFCPD